MADTKVGQPDNTAGKKSAPSRDAARSNNRAWPLSGVIGRFRDCSKVLIYKQVFLALGFLSLFLLTDGSSTAFQAWEGAPPCYVPVGITVALLLYGGLRYMPLVILSSLVAAALNYHRPMFSWCGIPGATLSYVGYFAGVALLRKHWRIDPKLESLRDAGRFVVTLSLAELCGAVVGMLTLFGDGLISRSAMVRAALDWYASDAIAIFTITPAVLLFVAPRVGSWVASDVRTSSLTPWLRTIPRLEIVEMTAQAGSIVLVIWLLFGLNAAAPYQPLYLLFIPVIWVAVRRGLPGASVVTLAINFGMTFAALLVHAPRGSLPRLQLAIVALGVTGLFLGAIVSERRRAEEKSR